MAVSAAFPGGEEIAESRDLTRSFLADLQAGHGLQIGARAREMVQLVVSELVTNARKHAPGPWLLSLELDGGVVEVSVWDTEPKAPVILPVDPQRVGQHGLEIVTAVCRDFEVHREPVGKRITAAIELVDDPGGNVAGQQVV
ncbi:ATP-binding protein [Streptomyces sp. NRRL S-813]|uniref:ATP-binding protein n=1 Tax=Streptomyces sp. NRRL S-813 TaxID=1463919 RepID=UPI001902893F|nr:ATP-binding protein [Streptomyces sp. NRRL S-813]